MPASVVVALVAVQVFFGLWPTAGSVALKELSPAALIGFRTLVGGPLLFAVVSGGRRWPNRRDLFTLAALAFFGITANQLLFAEGLERAGPINAIIMVVIIPVVTLAIGMLLKREKPNGRRILGVFITMVGVAVLVRIERFDLSSATLVGNLLFLANTSSYALYLVLAKPLVSRVGAMSAVGWLFLFGAIEALPWTGPAVAATDWTALSGGAWLSLGFILLGPTIGTYFLNAYALKYVDASIVAIFVGVQPIIGTLGAWVILGEVPTTRAVVAAFVITAGVLAASPAFQRHA